MTWKTLRRRCVLYVVNHIYKGTVFFEQKRKMLNSIGFDIGEGTKVVGPIDCTGTLKVGKNCWIGKNLSIHGNGSVVIGDNCDIAPDVTFLTGGHAIGSAERRAGQGETYRIIVGNGTWIAARTTILGNTAVGNSCVVAACACVTKDVPDNTLVGGVPAKEIRKLDV